VSLPIKQDIFLSLEKQKERKRDRQTDKQEGQGKCFTWKTTEHNTTQWLAFPKTGYQTYCQQ
jgi:hypothetical protein